MEPFILWALDSLLSNFMPTSTHATTSPNGQTFSQWLTSAKTPAPSSTALGASDANAAIATAASTTGLSANLLRAVATVESGMNSSAVSPAGAVGLMQLMPSTASMLGVDPTNPTQNALGGAEYLKSLLHQYGGNLPMALAAYNAGPGAVAHFGGIPPYAETQNYVTRVLSAMGGPSSTPATGSSSA